jgi:hypothetical protein
LWKRWKTAHNEKKSAKTVQIRQKLAKFPENGAKMAVFECRESRGGGARLREDKLHTRWRVYGEQTVSPGLFINMAETVLFHCRVAGSGFHQFSAMLPFGATIPTRLRRYSGLAGCPYSFTPPALHPGRTCRVNHPGSCGDAKGELEK